MADIIRLLPDSIANQIAAGEVIQRPASVVKELMENSVDAGATSISVSIVDAGKTSIQVVDNGKGMSETDARLAFERHATSKISQASDLFNLRTMGFRGEALASIVAVAQVELKTRTRDEDFGTYLVLKGSKIEDQQVIAFNVGTSFTVNNLFYNVPARRRFLKSNQTECNNIMTEFERVALIHPEIAFNYYRDEVKTLDLRPSSFRKRIVNMFGSNLDKQLLPVEVETSIVKISGFVGTPQSARAKSAHQFFFVNHRYMKHPYFHRAVMTAFERLVPSEKQVPYFLSLEVEPEKIDVNIHPTKTEIKFEDDQAIWQILLAAIRESLGKFEAAPTIDFDMGDVPEIPTINTLEVVSPKLNVDVSYNPFKSNGSCSKSYNHSAGHHVDWKKMYASIDQRVNGQQNENSETSYKEQTSAMLFQEGDLTDDGTQLSAEASAYLQHQGRYLITSVKSGLMVIDQVRASVRILFDKYMTQLTNGESISQQLLFPETMQVPLTRNEDFSNNLNYFRAAGFEILEQSEGNYQINGVPAGAEKQNPIDLITEIFDNILYNKEEVPEEKIFHQIALILAQRNSIVYGQVLTNEEILAMVEELFASTSPNFTPDGKAILSILPNERLGQPFL